MLLMFGGVVGVVLSTPDISKSALVYDVKRLQQLKEISFKVPNLEGKNRGEYNLLDGKLQRQPDDTWQERQQHKDGLQTYDYKQTKVIEGQIQYRRPDDAIELVVYFTERLIGWRKDCSQTGTGGYHCPYAVVSLQ